MTTQTSISKKNNKDLNEFIYGVKTLTIVVGLFASFFFAAHLLGC